MRSTLKDVNLRVVDFRNVLFLMISFEENNKIIFAIRNTIVELD
jgi:hypothetical protein